MSGESSPPIPVSEAQGRAPIHLRYFFLLKSNPRFRRLWLAQLISEIGDWFYSLAVYDLLLILTNSGKVVAWSIIIQTLPWFLMTPLAGHIVDRFSRRRLMIVADIARGVVVLGLLLVRARSAVWLAFLLLFIEVIFAAVFEPARNALLPNVTSEEELLPANALSTATWSFALTIGAGLGGAAMALFGRDVAFIMNSLSFFASAILIARIVVRETHVEPEHAAGETQKPQDGSIAEGAAYLRENPKISVLVLAKLGLGCMGGMLALLVIFGERIFPFAGKGALAMGLLYAARGVGAGLGPFIGDHIARDLQPRMWKIIGAGFLLMGAGYFAFSRSPTLAIALVAIFFGNIGSSNVWVMSTTLLQLNSADRFRGRVFALDFGLLMLSISASNFLIGKGLDDWGFSARQLAGFLGLMMLVPAVLWLLAQSRWGRADTAAGNHGHAQTGKV
jgi:predicted MFS family arabinose efflux permease